jgi:AraC-like DNA-binding protein
MISMLHDRKTHEFCELTEALLTERLCSEGMTGSIMKKLLFECLDLLYRGLEDSRAAIGEYAACVQHLNRCGTFRDAAGYLYSLYDLAAEALQPAGTQHPFGKEELDSYIQNHWNEDISLADAAAFFGLSGGYFSRIVRELAGKSFPDYLNGLRIARAEKLMRESDYSLAEISERCGFYSYKTFTRAFRKAYSLSPGEYRKGQR